MEGDEQDPEQDVSIQDDDWPYDPSWVDLGASPLDQLRSAVAFDQLRKLAPHPAAPTNGPTIAP
jgi:hypothetical protein